MSSISKAARSVAAALILATPFVALPAVAQTTVPAANPPSYGRASGDETITGHVENYDGKYNLTVRDQRGFVDNVNLHQGTIINPTGLTLRPGMSVTVSGLNRGNVLAANEIDTPYHFTPGIEYYGGYPYGYGFGFGYGGFGRGFGYGRFGW